MNSMLMQLGPHANFRAYGWNADCLFLVPMPDTDDLTNRVMRAIHEIVQYMTQHPEARDTLTGIRDWWLRPRNNYTSAELQQALDTLIGWGWLEKHTLVGQTLVYGVVEAGLGPASQFLKKVTDQES